MGTAILRGPAERRCDVAIAAENMDDEMAHEEARQDVPTVEDHTLQESRHARFNYTRLVATIENILHILQLNIVKSRETN